MASAQRAAHFESHEQRGQERFVSQQQEESVREMEQIRHTNATLDVAGSDSFRAQTEQAAIRIVTPHYKIPEKPGTDVKIGSSVADLSAKFAEANGADYKAERAQEHFRMQIIDPKVASHAHIPSHAIRDYARRHLIDDFPSLHGKRSFLDLDALEQLRLRKGNLGEATDRDKDLEKYLKNRDGKRWDLPPPPKVEDESLREFDRLRQNIDHLQKASFRRTKSLGELCAIVDETKRTSSAINGQKTLPEETSLPSSSSSSPSTNGIIGDFKAESKSPSSVDKMTPPTQKTRAPTQLFVNADSRRQHSDIQQIQPIERRQFPRIANGHQNHPGHPIARPLTIPSRADKAVQAAPADWQRHLLLIATEEGADILECQSQMMQPRGPSFPAAFPPPPKSILKQPQQQQQLQTSSYSLQNAGTEPDGHTWEDRGEIGLRVETDEQRAIIEQMQRNLAALRQPSPRGRSPFPAVPYEGPFFRLHEVSPNGQASHPVPLEMSPQQQNGFGGVPPPPPPPPPGWTPRQAAMNSAKVPTTGAWPVQSQMQPQFAQNGKPPYPTAAQQQMMPAQTGYLPDEGKVVYWPPLNEQQKQKPEVPPPKNLRDPERLEEFMRQERLQQEAEMVKNQREDELRERQFQAVQLQQQQLLIKQNQQQRTPNVVFSPQQSQAQMAAGFSPPQTNGYHQHLNGSQFEVDQRPGTSHSQHHAQQFQPSPQVVRVFEARPLSAGETEYAFASSGASPQTWRRTYIIDEQRAEQIDERNEILTSEEVLHRERFEIDLLKRRESFIEKPEKPPEIKRLGRRWQPPPEKPYRWPSASPGPGAIPAQQQPLSIHTNGMDAEHRWTPAVRDPGFRHETKQFTPEPSPPDSPIRGHGTGPLDDVAMRQTAGCVLPSPDGSHRPKTEFSKVRRPPSGGFLPHAPNAVRVVRRRESRVEELSETMPRNEGARSSRQTETYEPDDEEQYAHLTNGVNGHRSHPPNGQKRRQKQQQEQLPRHSSTVVQLEPLPRVEVRRRIKVLEARDQQQRSRSAVPDRHGARSPSAQRSMERIQRLTAPSPAPASYARAKRYVPPALPAGYRQQSQASGQPHDKPTVPARHARRMGEAVQNAAQWHQQNHEPLGAKLAAPSQMPRKQQQPSLNSQRPRGQSQQTNGEHGGWSQQNGSSKMTRIPITLTTMPGPNVEGGEARHIPRVEPAQNGKFTEFKQELFESSGTSAEGTASVNSPAQPSGGYLTDTSTATFWQFNGGGAVDSFSPHSLVSVNGCNGHGKGHGNGLLKVVASSSSRCSSSSLRNGQHLKERSVVKVEPPPPIRRKEIVEVRREVVKAPAIKHTVHRVEEKKRTEEVERRVVRRERRHKSRRMHRSHHSSSAAAGGGHHQEYHYGSWGGGGGGGGYRSSSASRRSGYTNGFGAGGEHHLPITYEGSRGGRGFSATSEASDRFFGKQNGFGGQHARYGSVSDSLRRGDLKYGPNGELLMNGAAAGNVKHHRVHKAHSTRDVFYHGDDGGGSHYSSFQRRGGPPPAEPFVEFPPTLDRRSDWSGGPEPPPHRRQFADEFGGGGVGQLTKARSFADWEEGGRQFGHRQNEDMARLESEFRDARLMRIPSGNMHEKEHHHREIPGGYETYSRETKAHSDRKLDGAPGTPSAEFSREASQQLQP